MDTLNHIQQFKSDGIEFLYKLNQRQLEQLLAVANDAYYNNQPLLTDNEFDIIKDYITDKYPTSTIVSQIGAPVKKMKVTLPFHMPSMDKIKPDTGILGMWTRKFNGPYVISCKLDGVSGMYSTVNSIPKLYTRGDGTIGQDISHLIPVFKLPMIKDIVVRGEFIIPKKVFDEKYKNSFANSRNLASGIINSKTIDSKTSDLHFVVYEVIVPILKPSDQMKFIQNNGFEWVQNMNTSTITNEILSNTLVNWRTTYEYEIDGIIVSDDKIYDRTQQNPEHSFAFKMVLSEQMAEAKVIDVIWNASKDGYLKPRVRIEPVKIGGVTIEYTTGFNANFIETNKIGIGAVIQLIRSGDVIPYIKSITTPAETAKMPTVPYHWTDTHIDIILDDINTDDTVQEKNITAFFTGIEVDGLSSGNVKRLMKAGYNTVQKIISMKKSDFMKIEGFKDKMVDKLYEGIRTRLKEATLVDIMAASNIFGRGIGKRKIIPVMEAYPDILTMNLSNDEKIKLLKQINGFGEESAKGFVLYIDNFLVFLTDCGLTDKLPEKKQSSASLTNEMNIATHILTGKHIVMTKVRDEAIINLLKQVGGVLDDNITKNTFVLITRSHDDVSGKTQKAVKQGIPIMTPDEFKQKYINT